MEENIIAKEMADTFIWSMRRKNIWEFDNNETERIKKLCEIFGKFILDEYDGVKDVLCETFKDEINESTPYIHTNLSGIDGEKALQDEINRMLDAGRA